MRVQAPIQAGFVLAAVLGSVRLGWAQAPAVRTHGDRHPHIERDSRGNLTFRNRHLVAVLPRGDDGYSALHLYPSSRPTQPNAPLCALVPTLAEVTWRDGGENRTGAFKPASVDVDGSELELRGTIGSGAARWNVSVQLGIGSEPWLSWRVRARPTTAASLVRLRALPVESAHGGPREALFPGVAFLDEYPAGSHSASDLASAITPNPERITIPLFAVSQEHRTVGVMWRSGQDWGGGAGDPAATFQSPSSVGGIHRMELSLPPKGAASPIELSPAREVSLEGKLVVLPETDSPTAVIREWVRAFGAPNHGGMPRSAPEERTLARKALRGPLWRSGAPGWVQSVPAPANARATLPPDHLMAVWMDSLLGGEPEVAAQAKAAFAAAEREGPLAPMLAFRQGGVEKALDAQRAAAFEAIDGQFPGGFWISPAQEAKDGPPQIEASYTAARARQALRYSVLTGDSHSAGAGLLALKYLSSGTTERPTGRFRLPLAGDSDGGLAPELSAAATTAEAFLLGFHQTGEERWLQQARYWADTGLAFIHFTAGSSDQLERVGAAVGRFSPESGRVSQAAGLVYARVLRDLTRVRPDSLYTAVADCIVASAMRQQGTSGEQTGLLPQYWSLNDRKGEGTWQSPVPLVDLLAARDAHDPAVGHVRTRVGPDRLFVATGAVIRETLTTGHRLRLKLRWLDDQTTFTVINGVPARPVTVELNRSPLIGPGVPVKRKYLRETEPSATPGWWYDADRGTLTLCLRHTGHDDDLEIRFPDSRERGEIQRVDTRVRPGR